MLLAPGEIAEGEGIFRHAHDAQIGLDAGMQPHACLGRAAGDHALDQRVPNEKLRHLFRRFRRDDEVEIAHNFLPAPITSRGADARGGGMLAQIVE